MPQKQKQKPLYLVCVNEKEHSRTALKYACAKAKARSGAVAMLYVVEPVDYNTIFSVADVIRDERRAEAQALLETFAEVAMERHIPAQSWVRDGMIAEEICACLKEHPEITMLLLGVAADGSSNKGGVLTSLTAMLGHRYHIPLLLVPGNLTDAQIEELN